MYTIICERLRVFKGGSCIVLNANQRSRLATCNGTRDSFERLAKPKVLTTSATGQNPTTETKTSPRIAGDTGIR